MAGKSGELVIVSAKQGWDALFGVRGDRLRENPRDHAAAVLYLALLLSVGTLPVIGVLAGASFAMGAAQTVVLLLGALVSAHLAVVLMVRRVRLGNQAFAALVLENAPSAALLLGALWGASIFTMLGTQVGGLNTAALIAGAMAVAWSVLTLATLPVAGAMFLTPLAAGILLGLIGFNAKPALASIAIISVILGIVPLVSLPLRRLFLKYLSDKIELREQRELVRILLKEFGTSPSDWVWHMDSAGKIDRVSDRFASAAQDEQMRLLGQNFCGFLRSLSSENEPIISQIESEIANRAMFQDIVVKVDRADEHWWRLTGKPLYDDHGGYAGYIGTASDITTARMAERKINFLAHHDNLTGLLNRAKFTEQLKTAVSRLERYGSPFCILYLDLDQFKAVNDGRGHMVGDRLLVEAAHRIRACLAENELAARLGGDEFAILLTQDCGAERAARLAANLVETIARPYHLDDDSTVSIGVSIGIAIAPINGTRPDQILRNADLALYRAKAEGRGTFRFFESHMDSTIRERRMLELEIREAIKNGEFVLHYQPLVSAETHEPDAFEALVRWNHPIRGIVPPVEFIPIAEQTGLIQQIGDWTIYEACHAAARWPEHIGVSVNLSARHFHLSDIGAVVKRALDDSGLSPKRLEIEITESLLIQNPDEMIAKLKDVKALGVSIAMDDFGTGYSSLSYLLKFPFDKIKIDKSFVTASSDDLAARDILRTIVDLAKSLKIRITAEGVETQGQVDFLRDLACNQLQGYYFAKALDEIDLAVYLMASFARTREISERPETTISPFIRKSA